ncbi:MAG TPA: sulfotransferase domain-containing protein, partial [Acetobacteraceae bacterium]|nr:sulfotransferase domain-containing protein [Acetobacteraceae bacterium]
SATSSSGASFDRALNANFSAAKLLQSIEAEKNPGIMFLKYEDFVLDNEKTIDRIFRFCGLASIRSDERGMNDLFATHATSSSPAASIGRWKKDLSTEQLKKCEVFNPFLNYFEYET